VREGGGGGGAGVADLGKRRGPMILRKGTIVRSGTLNPMQGCKNEKTTWNGGERNQRGRWVEIHTNDKRADRVALGRREDGARHGAQRGWGHFHSFLGCLGRKRGSHQGLMTFGKKKRLSSAHRDEGLRRGRRNLRHWRNRKRVVSFARGKRQSLMGVGGEGKKVVNLDEDGRPEAENGKPAKKRRIKKCRGRTGEKINPSVTKTAQGM